MCLQGPNKTHHPILDNSQWADIFSSNSKTELRLAVVCVTHQQLKAKDPAYQPPSSQLGALPSALPEGMTNGVDLFADSAHRRVGITRHLAQDEWRQEPIGAIIEEVRAGAARLDGKESAAYMALCKSQGEDALLFAWAQQIVRPSCSSDHFDMHQSWCEGCLTPPGGGAAGALAACMHRSQLRSMLQASIQLRPTLLHMCRKVARMAANPA